MLTTRRLIHLQNFSTSVTALNAPLTSTASVIIELKDCNSDWKIVGGNVKHKIFNTSNGKHNMRDFNDAAGRPVFTITSFDCANSAAGDDVLAVVIKENNNTFKSCTAAVVVVG